eukprot:1752109-Pleurochrysis_carterae.AAC.1
MQVPKLFQVPRVGAYAVSAAVLFVVVCRIVNDRLLVAKDEMKLSDLQILKILMIAAACITAAAYGVDAVCGIQTTPVTQTYSGSAISMGSQALPAAGFSTVKIDRVVR